MKAVSIITAFFYENEPTIFSIVDDTMMINLKSHGRIS